MGSVVPQAGEGPGAQGGEDTPEVSPAVRASSAADARCIGEIQAGRMEGFQELVERYQQVVLGIVLSYVKDPHRAEDVSQEVFLKAFSRLGQLRTPELFFPWLLQIARHRASREVLKANRRPEVALMPEVEPEAPVAASTVNQAAAIMAMVEELPEPYRHTVILKYQQGLSCREIAEQEQVAIGTITSRLTRALAVLRSALGLPER